MKFRFYRLKNVQMLAVSHGFFFFNLSSLILNSALQFRNFKIWIRYFYNPTTRAQASWDEEWWLTSLGIPCTTQHAVVAERILVNSYRTLRVMLELEPSLLATKLQKWIHIIKLSLDTQSGRHKKFKNLSYDRSESAIVIDSSQWKQKRDLLEGISQLMAFFQETHRTRFGGFPTRKSNLEKQPTGQLAETPAPATS